MRRIIVVTGVAMSCYWWTGDAYTQQQLPPLRTDVVAVVFTDRGGGQGTISITYPGNMLRQDIERDLQVMQSVSEWQFTAPSVTALPEGTQAVAPMTPPAGLGANYGEPVWPVVWAMKRFNRLAVVIISPHYRGAAGTLDNRFVSVTSSGGGAVWIYDVTIKDNSFSSLAEVRAMPVATPAPQQPPPPRSGKWIALGLAAVMLGVMAYVIAARATRGGEEAAARWRAGASAGRSTHGRVVRR